MTEANGATSKKVPIKRCILSQTRELALIQDKVLSDIIENLHAIGITRTSKYQSDLLGHLLARHGENIIVKGGPVTGKSMTCGIVALNKIDLSKSYPQVLFICATHESALQTSNFLRKLAINTNIKIETALKDGMLSNLRIQLIIYCLMFYKLVFDYFEMAVYCLLKNIFYHISAALPWHKLDCHLLVGSPKEIVAFKKMQLFNAEKISLCIFDGADAVVTTKLVNDNIINCVAKSRKILISSTIDKTNVDFLKPYIVHSDDLPINLNHAYVFRQTNQEKLIALLTVNIVITRLNIQGIVFF